MKERMLITITVIVLSVTVASIFSFAGGPFGYQKAMSLQRGIVSFAVLHDGRLPKSWDELASPYGKYTEWTLEELKKFGVLRWSWNLGDLPPDRKYVYVQNEKYVRYEHEMNCEILKQGGFDCDK